MENILSLPYRLEILGLTLFGWLILYFFVNRLKVEPNNRLDLGTSIDLKIPFIPQFSLIYFSTYIFVIQPFFILAKAGQFYWMLVCFVSISTFASLIHAVLPSKITRNEEINTESISGKLLALFQKTCKPYGNFPSMHVGLSVPVIVANFMVGGIISGSICLLWAILISLSTLFTKQHYILDVLAGLIGGVIIFGITFWCMLA